MVLAVSALAAPSDPGETALHFLEKVRTRNVNLAPGSDTAISPQTSEKKRGEISRRLARMANDLGKEPLEVGPVRLDGELAAVLVRRMGGFDPNRIQVFPVALVRRGSDWVAAPVPASFENTGVGYASALRERLRTLEDWMLRERTLDMETLRARSAERMRRNIATSLPTETLRNLDSRQAAKRFLDACAERKLPEVLGLLGGLSASLPEDWPLRLKAAEAAMADIGGGKRPWRLLVAPEVIRLPVEHQADDESGSAMVSIACLDPSGSKARTKSPKVELIHLELEKTSDGLWRIDPPSSFTRESGGEEEDEDEDDSMDTDLLDLFPKKLSAKYPPTPFAYAGLAKDALLAALVDERSDSWVPLVRFQDSPGTGREACIRAARLWWEIHDPAASRQIIPLDLHEIGDTAVASCQFFDTRNPDRLNLRVLFFEKSPSGWFWLPNPGTEIRSAFSEWSRHQTDRWKDGDWRETMLGECLVIDHFKGRDAPDEAGASKLAESWLQTLRKGRVIEALRLTARLNLPDSNATILRNLGYEIAGSGKSTPQPSVGVIRAGKGLTLVSAKPESGSKTSFPLYPLIQTPAGPRILLEIDLAASGGRSRDFLNRIALERLHKFNPEAAAELRELLESLGKPPSDSQAR